MIKGLVSIVIPIYNVEKYLVRCMESVVNQTYKNIEIIMVDDGSPDSCPALCDEWAQKDSRIKVVHKENAGLGMARNTGIEYATGEYICFFDSDDYIRLDAIEKTYQCMEKENADIVIFGHQDVDKNGRVILDVIPQVKQYVYQNEEVQDVFLPALIGKDIETGRGTNLWMSAWSCAYSMSLIERTGFRFVSERKIISEDVYSLLGLYAEVKKVCVITEPLYCYCKNEGSLTRTYRQDRFEKIKYFYDSCQALCEEKGYNEEIKARLSEPYLSSVLAALKQIMQAEMKGEERKKVAYAILKDEHLYNVLSLNVWKKDNFFKRVFFSQILKKRYYFAYIILFWWAKLKK